MEIRENKREEESMKKGEQLSGKVMKKSGGVLTGFSRVDRFFLSL
jgi:hypothetical protein